MGFNKILWGFIFLFDFRIGGFDILPDIVGFILIVVGLNEVLKINSKFETAKKSALVLVFLSVFDLIPAQSISNFYFVFIIIGVFNTILNLVMVYNICMGIAESAEAADKTELGNLARSRCSLYIIGQILLILSLLLVFALPIIAFAVGIYNLVVTIMILVMLNRANSELICYM